MKKQSGFSLVEVMVSVLVVSGLVLAMGYSLAIQKKQEVDRTHRLSLTSSLENVAHRLNSADSAAQKFAEFQKLIQDKNPGLLATFEDCIQKKATSGCAVFSDTTQYPSLTETETVSISSKVSLQVTWTSAIQCDADNCSSINRSAVATLIPATSEVQGSPEFQAMTAQMARTLVSSQRNFPLFNLVAKRDMDYSCAANPGAPVVGLNPDNVEALCAPLTGAYECDTSGSRPLQSFGGATSRCAPLVSVSCSQGIGDGGFFDGSCKPETKGSLTTYLQKDASGNVTKVTICGASGSGCLEVAASGTTDIIKELEKSSQFSQLINTWDKEGVLLPLDTLGIGEAGSFDYYYGTQLEGSSGIKIQTTTTVSAGSDVTVVDGAVGKGGSALDPNIFN